MGTASSIVPKQPVVLYDGVCNFCNSSVNFILRHEKTSELQFAALQSEYGQKLLAEHDEKVQDYDSIILLDENGLSKKSKAAFKIAKSLKAPWSYLSIFRFLPRFIADFFYDLIAQNRYRIFGKTDACMVPTADIRSRFLGV
ncbi:MAG: thiol-disulfide oxidoreductase DCC family protein [Cyclobacteriaceae bacterium]